MVLLEELVEEILLRVPPDEPAYLIRATLVCKRWFRILSDRNFLRRYRVFHRTPPLLGYMNNPFGSLASVVRRFVQVPTASPVPEPVLGSSCCHALDCRHGRVLIRILEPDDDRLVVWDPVTGDQRHLSPPTYPRTVYTGAVLCAMEACDHLNCHGGPFKVVFVGGNRDYGIRASVYSSETHVWGTWASTHADHLTNFKQSILVEGMLYFTLFGGQSILKYELGRHRLSVIDAPGVFYNMVMTKAEDGGLGFVAVEGNCINFWMQQAAGTNDSRTRWVHHRVIKIYALLPPIQYRPYSRKEVISYAEDNHTILINRDEEVIMLDLKSRHVRKIGGRGTYNTILPYVSFYTPDLAKGRLSPS